MRLRGRSGFLRNRRALDWVRRVKRALIAGQRKNPAQAALAMLQSRSSDFMIAMDLCEQVGSIYRSKIPQAYLSQVWRQVRIPESFIACNGRWLAIFSRPGKPVPFRKFRNG